MLSYGSFYLFSPPLYLGLGGGFVFSPWKILKTALFYFGLTRNLSNQQGVKAVR
jgi:hypothetical protein